MARRVALSVLVALLVVASASAGARLDGAAEFTFYPQAGILWRDLYPNNFVDLDPGAGVRDHACGTQTYDGHTGTDSDIRSFREMDIGVPVFAALDGRVISVQDGEFDRNYGPTVARFDNHVVLEHAPGRFTIYGHLRKGIRLKRNDRVVAGQQLGWTASSGNSSWPHLHFTSQVASAIHEPFAGACNAVPSGWTEQVPWPTKPYVRDLALSAKPMTGRRAPPHDLAERTGTFVRGARMVYSRVELGAAPSGEPLRLRYLRPDGVEAGGWSTVASMFHGRADWRFGQRMPLHRLGRWQVVVELGGDELARTTFDVVASATGVRNRPPRRVAVELVPPTPSPATAVECRVTTELFAEDPDFEIVRYRYRWTVDGKVVRAVRSAALSDALRKGAAAAGRTVRCSVTPGDGKLWGPTATVSAIAR